MYARPLPFMPELERALSYTAYHRRVIANTKPLRPIIFIHIAVTILDITADFDCDIGSGAGWLLREEPRERPRASGQKIQGG